MGAAGAWRHIRRAVRGTNLTVRAVMASSKRSTAAIVGIKPL